MNVTSELLEAFAVSDRQKHEGCVPGKCQHSKESDAEAEMITAAAMGAETWRKLVDRQVMLTIRQAASEAGIVNAIRVNALYFVLIGIELAKFQADAEATNKAFDVSA